MEAPNKYPISASIPSGYTVRFTKNVVKNTNGSILAYFSTTNNHTINNNFWYDSDGSQIIFGSYGVRTPAWLEANTNQFDGQESEDPPSSGFLPAPGRLRVEEALSQVRF